MSQSAEYITDPLILDQARKANELYDLAQDRLGAGLWLAYLMARNSPQFSAAIEPFATVIAHQGVDYANEFTGLTGEKLHVDPKAVKEVKDRVLDDLRFARVGRRAVL